MSSPPNKRILLVTAHWLGDVLFLTPAIRAIRKKYPDAYLAALAPPRVRRVLERNPHLNEVLTMNDRASIRGWIGWVPVIFEIRKRHFDTAIIFLRSKTKAFLLKMAGIPERLGYSAKGRDQWLTRVVRLPETRWHPLDLHLNLIGEAGIPSEGRHMEFFPDPAAEGSLRQKLREHGITSTQRYAVVHAGGNWALKRWRPDYFAECIRSFMKEFSFKTILCGTSAEEGVCREIQSLVSAGEVISLCGKTSLDELAWLMKNAEFLLSNDSGPLHLAASQGTRVIGLFGPTSPELTGPSSLAPVGVLQKEVGCEVPCYYRSCNYRVCMDWLMPEQVIEKVKELMLSGGRKPVANTNTLNRMSLRGA